MIVSLIKVSVLRWSKILVGLVGIILFLQACGSSNHNLIMSDVKTISNEQQKNLSAYVDEYGDENVDLVTISNKNISREGFKRELAINYINNYQLLSGAYFPDLAGFERQAEWTNKRLNELDAGKEIGKDELKNIYDEIIKYAHIEYISSKHAGGIDARAFIADRQVILRALGGNVHALISINSNNIPEDFEDDDYEVNLLDVDGLDDTDDSDLLNTERTIRVLNYVSKDAAEKLLSIPLNSSLDSYVSRLTEDVNKRLRGQKVDIAIENAGIKVLDYKSTFYGQTLRRMADPDDGFFPDLEKDRQKAEADVVAFFSTTDPTSRTRCGRVMGLGFAQYDTAFFVVRQDCALYRMSYHHELAHLMGAEHENKAGSVGEYQFGHHDEKHKFRSIMSKKKCCTRRPVWSDPKQLFPNNDKKGVQDLADNARWINEHGFKLANLFENHTIATIELPAADEADLADDE